MIIARYCVALCKFYGINVDQKRQQMLGVDWVCIHTEARLDMHVCGRPCLPAAVTVLAQAPSWSSSLTVLSVPPTAAQCRGVAPSSAALVRPRPHMRTSAKTCARPHSVAIQLSGKLPLMECLRLTLQHGVQAIFEATCHVGLYKANEFLCMVVTHGHSRASDRRDPLADPWPARRRSRRNRPRSTATLGQDIRSPVTVVHDQAPALSEPP